MLGAFLKLALFINSNLFMIDTDFKEMMLTW